MSVQPQGQLIIFAMNCVCEWVWYMFFTQLAYYDHIACGVYSCYNLMGEGNILQVEDMPTLLKLPVFEFSYLCTRKRIC
jgi:hypothetical protein